MRRCAVVAAAAVIWMATGHSLAQGRPPAPKSTAPVTVLDTYGVWRTFHLLKPPVIQFDDGPKPVLTPNDWLNRATPAAPADWTKPEFDDTSWGRGSALAFAGTPYLARLYQRARFEVTDPAAVKELKLSLSYYGGAIVYVNGQQLVRGHLAKAGTAELAESYPLEAFVTDDGKLLPGGGVALRERSLTDVAIPSKLLREGVNVIAVEIVRAPFHKIVDEKKARPGDRDAARKGTPYNLTWRTCEMRKVQLVASGGDGLVPNAVRPKVLQVWNGDFLTPDHESDRGDRCAPLRPVTIQAVRNGWFSGKVILGAPKPIAALKASCGDLKHGDDTIPASAVRVRYGASWGSGWIDGYNQATRSGAPLLDALLEAPLGAFPGGTYGTVVPIWMTVKVPATAKAGIYKGDLTVTAKGEEPLTVPVRLEVADWTVPNAQEYRTWVELIQSPDTLVVEYGAPMWSDRHWEMIDQSLGYIGEIGSGMIYVPLICHTNSGNAQSMVRWIRKDKGRCEYDFSVMDKYLDLAARHIPKPKFVVFTAWEIYLNAPKQTTTVEVKGSEGSYEWYESSAVKARQEWRGKGPVVTALDPATGKTEDLLLPRFENPAAKPLWKPLFAEIRKRMAGRGWEKAMALGMAADIWPTKDEVSVLQEVSGGLPWVRHSHGGGNVGQKMHGIGRIDYTAYVWNVKYGPDPATGHAYGWKQPSLVAQYRRGPALNLISPAAIMHFEELNITGAQRGVGRIGADYWPAIKDKRGRRKGCVCARYPQSYWHSLNLASHLLVPGPNGPVASTRYEYFREGIQQCEARIAIERALTDEASKANLGPELAGRCQNVLDERLRALWRAGSSMQLSGRDYASAEVNGDSYGGLWSGGVAGHFWFAGSGWQDRTRQLYDLAGEVTRKLAGK